MPERFLFEVERVLSKFGTSRFAYGKAAPTVAEPTSAPPRRGFQKIELTGGAPHLPKNRPIRYLLLVTRYSLHAYPTNRSAPNDSPDR